MALKVNYSHSESQEGQGLVEYALILVLVAIVVIATLMVLGPKIGNVFTAINNSLSAASLGGSGGVTQYNSINYPIEQNAINAYCAANGHGASYYVILNSSPWYISSTNDSGQGQLGHCP
jgi:pilus assembly protein Flp/PilA